MVVVRATRFKWVDQSYCRLTQCSSNNHINPSKQLLHIRYHCCKAQGIVDKKVLLQEERGNQRVYKDQL
jgi:hypothetical protein